MSNYFFRCSTNPALYLVTDKPEIPANVNPDLCPYGHWVFDSTVDPKADAKFDISEERVKKDIAEQGYSIVRWKLGKRAPRAHSDTT